MFCSLVPFRKLWVAGLVLVISPMISCGRYRARHELKLNEYFAQIVERVDRRWLGNDRFFEDNLLSNPYPEVRQWCAIALGRISSPRALPMLFSAMHKGDTAVRAAAAFSVGEILDRGLPGRQPITPSSQAISEVRALLDDPSVSVQMRAVEALGKIGSRAEAAEIIRRLERFTPHEGRAVTERAYIEFAITALGRLKDPAAIPLLDRLSKGTDPEIRRRASEARRLLDEKAIAPVALSESADVNSGQVAPPALLQVGLGANFNDPGPVESPITDTVSRAVASSRRNSTIAVVETTRGTIEIELFREDAPLTVTNFVLTAKRGNYNFVKQDDGAQRRSGFLFDEVIPSQRIGGEVLGTQTGFGWTMEGEVNMRPFERGSIGMSVGREDPGRRHIFIALAPQPYLDGIDTCFGRVISGMPVADKIVDGDRILRVTIKETITFQDHIRF